MNDSNLTYNKKYKFEIDFYKKYNCVSELPYQKQLDSILPMLQHFRKHVSENLPPTLSSIYDVPKFLTKGVFVDVNQQGYGVILRHETSLNWTVLMSDGLIRNVEEEHIRAVSTQEYVSGNLPNKNAKSIIN